MKKTLPNVGAIQIEYKDILKMTPSINQQIDHLLWFLIGGGSPTMTFIELDIGNGEKLTSDGVMRLVVTSRREASTRLPSGRHHGHCRAGPRGRRHGGARDVQERDPNHEHAIVSHPRFCDISMWG
ncbi:MAG: hypothetical protein KGL39_30100 [Patescibacteria group bacterium]|nr:hypothetical protein [Patescibacteria group bacterium]